MLGLPRTLLAAVCLYAAAWSCGLASPNRGEGSPCTRTVDCRVPLVCAAGVCRSGLDGGGDAAVPSDASVDAESLDARALDASDGARDAHAEPDGPG